MSFLRLNNLLRTRPDPEREDRPTHSDRSPADRALQGEIEPAAAMQRALREDEPSRLRQRIEAVEARAVAAEAEARNAKSAHARAVLEVAHAIQNSKDEQRRLRADMQTKIDALREALRLANADSWSNSGGAAMSKATKKALKANLALRLESMQEGHTRELEQLAAEAERHLAQELESKLSGAQAESDRARQDAVAERDRFWEVELEHRLNQARMPAPMEPPVTTVERLIPKTWDILFFEAARDMAPGRRQMLALVGIGVIAAAIGFAAAQVLSSPLTETARSSPSTPVASRALTAADPTPPVVSETVKETLPSTEASRLAATEAAATPSTPDAEPADALAEVRSAIPPRAEPAAPPTDSAPATAQPADSPHPPAATALQATKDAESVAQPTEARAMTATGAQPTADNAAAVQVRSLQRQAALLRQKLREAEQRASAAQRDALAATIALEEAQAQTQSTNDASETARDTRVIDAVDIFAPTE